MTGSPHPPELRSLCGRAAQEFESLLGQDLTERGVTLARLQVLLGQIHDSVVELDLRDPDFPREQGWLVDASSALQSIGLDRGGWNVEKLVHRAVEDLRRVAEG
jgi:hypothetical protein